MKAPDSCRVVLFGIREFHAGNRNRKPGHFRAAGPRQSRRDGKLDDWDLSGGVFACGDVENQRDKFAVWIHAMYDADNLYLLARWIDETPMNNPGQVAGSYGFAGDCLQFRIDHRRRTRRRSAATTSPAGATATAAT